jgi:hypothetical protein
MSQFERNLKILERRRVIYRRDPINDKPTETFDWGRFYKDGTYECYSLFRSKAKISTYKSLKWHLYVLWYLNPQMDQDELTSIVNIITKKENGFITFHLPEQLKQNMIYDVSLEDLERAPANKSRKIIFSDNCLLSTSEKLSIVGSMIGKSKLTESEIYEAMLYTHDEGKKITVKNIADALGCSTRTVHRNMGNELKKEKELLNQQLGSIINGCNY